MAKQFEWSRVSVWPIITATVSAAALTGLLLYGLESARTLEAASTALQRASELSGEPQVLRSQLALLQRSLENRSFAGDNLHALVAERARVNGTLAELEAAIGAARLGGEPQIAPALSAIKDQWSDLDQSLRDLADIGAEDLYVDTATGSNYTAQGARLKRGVDSVFRDQSQSGRKLAPELTSLSSTLQQAVAAQGRQLRQNLIAGTAMAGALLLLMLYFAWSSRRSVARATQAEQQIDNILGTVREGLFLIDREGRIGSTFSDSLNKLLRLQAPASGTIEDLLRPLVDDKTLVAASKYLGLFWKDKVHEDLIESVNPLAQIEVAFPGPRGAETRYLSFSFRRARGTAPTQSFIFGVVTDVTDRVLLQREVASVKADSDAQASVMLELLKVDPVQLESFIGYVDASVRQANDLLRSPAKDPEALRLKVDGVFREMHSLKGEALALGLGAFARHIHAVEDLLSTLRARDDLTGDEFVAVVVRISELMDYRTQIIELQQRIAGFRAAIPAAGPKGGMAEGGAPEVRSPEAPAQHGDLAAHLQSLAQAVATDCQRTARLLTGGLERVPAIHAARVRDICVQLVRNAIVHGVEEPAERVRTGKPATATVRVDFVPDGEDRFVLRVEDDGRGLRYEDILKRAMLTGLVRPEQAASIRQEDVLKLIMEPGFSTADAVSLHAGRGVGLNLVSEKLKECDGRLSIATKPGAYTRFTVRLPGQAAGQVRSSVA